MNDTDYPLLGTKLHIPEPRRKLVPRTALIERLNNGTRRKLTLISAPAGFGKTTILSEWVYQTQLPVAWISLDRGDNDPEHLTRYAIAALRKIKPKIGETALNLLRLSQPPPYDAIIYNLVREIENVPQDMVLVLDDYHEIDTEQIHQLVELLLNNLPPQLHLVLATRVDPPLPLARMRVRHQLTEFRVSDLCFTEDETTRFFNKVMNLNLSNRDIALLESRTEGWIAGLQLAALSMQGRSDIPRFIKTFAGDNRYIVDYLVEEVLNLQSADVQDFLLHTSILNRLCEPLCDYVTNRQGSRKILEYLDKANLFIVPLDNQRNWYRYHHLFADLLRQRLKQKEQDMVSRLHIKASEWLEANDFMEDAIDYALMAGDFHGAVRLIEGFIDTKWHGGQQVMLFKWLDQLPDEIKLNKPDLGLCHARFLFESGRQEAAKNRIDQLEKIYVSGLKSRQNSVGENKSSEGSKSLVLKGRIAAIRAYMASRKGDIHDITKYAEEALAYLPDDDFDWHTVVALSSGIAYHVAGDSTAALRAHAEAEAAARESGNGYFYLMAKIRRIMEMKNTGRLSEAIDICRELSAEVRERYSSFEVALGHVYGVRGELLYELNDLGEALGCTEKSIQLIERGHDVGVLGYRYCCLVRILCSKGDVAAARKIGGTADRLVLDSGVPPWVMSQIRAAKGNLWLKEGKLNALENRIEEWGLKIDDGNIMARESEYMLFSRFLMAQRRFKDALSLLYRLIDQEKKGGRVISQIEALLIQATVFSEQHKMVEAMGAIRKALSLAEPGGYVRLFVDEAQNINELLEKSLDTGDNIPKAFVKKLLIARKLSRAIEKDRSPIEPLSDRELEVLRCVAAGLSNKKITEALFISLSTVKTHMRNIFGKLDVHRRTEAVAKAKDLGILN